MKKINELLIKELYDKGYKDSDIAKQLKCDLVTIFLWRKRNNFKSNTELYLIYLEKRVKKLFELGYSKTEISKIVKKSHSRICAILKGLDNNPSIKNCEDVIVGTLLGDGWVNNQMSFGFAHKETHKEYLDYKINLIALKYSIYYREQYRNSTLCKSYSAYFSRNKSWNTLRSIFYVDGKKIFPKEYLNPVFTWRSFAMWFMDDGSKHVKAGSLAIHNFKSQSEEIKNFLFEKLNINCTIQSKGTILYFKEDSMEYIYDNIKQYIPKCMLYKFNVLNKSDKLLENPEEDNQQPIITLNE